MSLCSSLTRCVGVGLRDQQNTSKGWPVTSQVGSWKTLCGSCLAFSEHLLWGMPAAMSGAHNSVEGPSGWGRKATAPRNWGSSPKATSVSLEEDPAASSSLQMTAALASNVCVTTSWAILSQNHPPHRTLWKSLGFRVVCYRAMVTDTELYFWLSQTQKPWQVGTESLYSVSKTQMTD